MSYLGPNQLIFAPVIIPLERTQVFWPGIKAGRQGSWALAHGQHCSLPVSWLALITHRWPAAEGAIEPRCYLTEPIWPEPRWDITHLELLYSSAILA